MAKLKQQQQQQPKGPQPLTAQQTAELATMKKQIDDKARSLEDTEKKLAKRQQDLDQMEKQLQSALKQATGPGGQPNEALLIELKNRCEKLDKEKEQITNELKKTKDEAIRVQSELERLLQIMTASEEEKFLLNKQIQDLQKYLFNLKLS